MFHSINMEVLEQFPFVQSLLIQEVAKIKKGNEDLNKLKALKEQGIMCERGSCCKK